MDRFQKAFDSLNDTFKPDVEFILSELKKKGYDAVVVEGRRTLEQQQEKVRRGVSKTLKSAHLGGNAADICDRRFLWNIPLTHRFWLDLGKLVIHRGKISKICWGGIWSLGEIDTDQEKSRWSIYQKACRLGQPGLIKWFADVAHVEKRA